MSETYPRPDLQPEVAPMPRNPFGWIALGLMFAYLIFGATTRATAETPGARAERYTNQLKTAMQVYEAGASPVAGLLSAGSPDEPLRKLEGETALRRRQEPVEAATWATVRKVLGEPVTDADLAPLRREKAYALLVEAFREGERSKAEAQSLVARLEARKPPARVTADIVRREAGLPVPKRPKNPAGTVAVVFLGGALILGSGAAWLLAAALGLSGALRPQGPATEVPTPGAADVLAMRAAALMFAFLVLQTGAAYAVRAGLDSRAGSVLAYGAMLVVVPLALRRAPSMADVGFHGRTFWRDVGLGLWAFLLELPVTAILAMVAYAALKGLPQPQHPASTALASSPDLWTILATLFGGAIVAPFWEETMFRGLLFPAIRRFGGPVVAALASSFLFASIHPQGPVLWAALASVALFSCVLAQNTRSLVPSITMHLAHNATIMVLAVLAGR